VNNRLQRLWQVAAAHPATYALPAVLVVAATLLGVIGTPWHLTGDFSHTEFLVRSIPRHPPLIGVAARVEDNGSTLGPGMAYALWPGYTLLGRNAFALTASLAILHLLALTASIVVAGRVGGRLLAACLAVSLTVMTVSFAPRFFLEPWNVWVPVFAFGLFVVLIWAASCGRLWALPTALAVGSYCMQAHVSYSLIVVGLLVTVTAWIIWTCWRTERHGAGRLARWLGVSGLVGVGMWALPIIEQFQSGTGNLRKVINEFRSPDDPFIGPRSASKAIAGRLNLFGPWLHDPLKSPIADPNLIGFALFLALVAAGAWCAGRRRWRPEMLLFGVLTVATLLGFVSTVRIFGPFFEYVIRWMVPLAALWIGVSSWSILKTLVERRGVADEQRTGDGAVGIGLAAVISLLATIGAIRSVGADVPYRADSDIAGQLGQQLVNALPAGTLYQIDERDPVALGSVAYGLHLFLERNGRPDGVGPWGVAGVKEYRVVADDQSDGVLWFVATQRVIDGFTTVPGATVVARTDATSSTDTIRSIDLEQTIVETLCEAGRSDLLPLFGKRWGLSEMLFTSDLPASIPPVLVELTSLRQATAVVLLPVGVDGDTIPVASPTC
jgi:hypothetical protein